MLEIARTNDIVLISVIESILGPAQIDYFVADEHMSVLEGSTGFMQRRILVVEDQAAQARRLLAEAGLADELARG